MTFSSGNGVARPGRRGDRRVGVCRFRRRKVETGDRDLEVGGVNDDYDEGDGDHPAEGGGQARVVEVEQVLVEPRGKLFEKKIRGEKISGWKPMHLTSVFSLWTSVTSPHGTMLTAFAEVKYGCLQMLDGLVSTHP